MQQVTPGRKNEKLVQEMERVPARPISLENLAPPRGLAIAAMLVVLLYGLAQAGPFIVPLSIAMFFAFLLTPLVRVLRRLHVPEAISIAIGALLIILPISALGYLIVAQAQAFSHDFPRIIHSVNALIAKISSSSIGRRLNVASYLDARMLTDRLASSAGQGLQLLISGLGTLLNVGSQTVLISLFTVVMIASRDHIRGSFERILATQSGFSGTQVLDDITRLVERFLIARFLIVLIIGATDAAILAAFKIPYVWLMGVFLGFMTLVPAIGFPIAAVPPVLVSLASGHSGVSTAAMLGALFAMSFIEGNVLTPKMVGKSLDINALFTFIGLFAGALLWGIWGMVLSIPLLGVLRIAFNASPRLAPWAELLSDKRSGKEQSSGRPASSPRVRSGRA